jgi:hypothetical protein
MQDYQEGRKMRVKSLLFAATIWLSQGAHASTWKGLIFDSGFLIRQNVDLAKYCLVVQVTNPTKDPVLIPSVSLFNPSRDVTVRDAVTDKEIESDVSGGLSASGDTKVNVRGVIINPNSWIMIVIPLRGIRVFDESIPGSYKASHSLFGDIFPEFSIAKNGDVRMGEPKGGVGRK